METNKSKSWIIVVFFTLFMAIMTLNLIVFPACAADTMEKFSIDQSGLTMLSSITSVVGLFGGLIFGPMLDKFGSRKVVTVSMLIGVIFFYCRVFTDSYTFVVILTFLASFFIGVCQVASSKVLDTWFTKENVSVAMSLQAGGAGFGSACAFILGSAFGLQTCLLIIAVAYTLLFLMWAAFGKEGPIKSGMPAEMPKGSMVTVYKSSYVWILSVAYSCVVGGTLLINSYCINAFVAKGLSPSGAAAMGTVINLSLLVGGYFGSFLLGTLKRYNLVNSICFAGGGIGYLASWFLPLGTLTWIFMVLGGLFIGGGIGVCVGRTPLLPLTKQFGQESIGTAAGALETIKGTLTFVFPIVIANLFPANYNAIFIIFGILCVLGILTGGVLIPELGPKGKLQQNFKK